MKYLLYVDHYQKKQPFLVENDPRFVKIREVSFKPSDRAKNIFFEKPVYAFLFAIFGLFDPGLLFALQYLTEKEDYSAKDAERFLEKIT